MQRVVLYNEKGVKHLCSVHSGSIQADHKHTHAGSSVLCKFLDDLNLQRDEKSEARSMFLGLNFFVLMEKHRLYAIRNVK